MKIGIIGSGSYAIALASLLNKKNIHLTMWTKFQNEYQELITKHTNSSYINYKLDHNIKITMDLNKLVKENDILILAIPTKYIYKTLATLQEKINKKYVLIATKGIENITNKLIHKYLYDIYKVKKVACISGPSFANDIIKKEPLGFTIASKNKFTLNYFANIFQDISFVSIQTTNDIIGIELCGIFKNIIAIFAGILEGMQLNSSTKAKFIVEASINIQEIIINLGGKKESFYTYGGLGDLILSATSTESRNFTFGHLIGLDKDYQSYLQNNTVEGLENLNSLQKFLQKNNIFSPIIDTLIQIIYQDKSKDIILNFLKK